MSTVTTDQLPLRNLRLQQEIVQFLEHLLVRLQRFRRRCLGRQLGKPQLRNQQSAKGREKGVRAWLNEQNSIPGKLHARKLASVDVTRRAAQSRRGRTLTKSLGFSSMSSCTSSASLGCRGYESEDALHVLTAQVRKLRLSIFISFFRRRGCGLKRYRLWNFAALSCEFLSWVLASKVAT